MTDDFHRYVTIERASKVSGVPVGTLRDWLRKGAIRKHTNAAGFIVLIDLEELRPRPKVDSETRHTA